MYLAFFEQIVAKTVESLADSPTGRFLTGITETSPSPAARLLRSAASVFSQAATSGRLCDNALSVASALNGERRTNRKPFCVRNTAN